MIVEYHRPEKLEAALDLLARQAPITKPIGGGTVLNRPQGEPLVGVDLQLLGLQEVEVKGKLLSLGARLTLQSLLDVTELPAALHDAIRLEATYHLRQVATLAGSLVASTGRSTLATALLAMDASVTILRQRQKPVTLGVGVLYAQREEILRGALISHILLPITTRLAFLSVGRTPADQPLVCVAVAGWISGRTRVALGGWGDMPLLAMDGPEAAGAQIAAENSYRQAADEWASAMYRCHTAGVLAGRCLEQLQITSRQ